MKRFLIVLTALILGYLAYDTARYYLGWYIDLQPDAPVSAFMSTDAQHLYMDRGAGPEEFTVKGVNLGVGVPGEWATDYAVSKETYLRWFAQMQEMGANTVRVYITLHDDFYNAFYEYNTLREENGEEPLWLIHGVWVNDYIQNSHRDAYDKDFLETFVRDGRTLVDVLHGNKKISLGRGTGSGFYNKDVSRWVIGYILGVEWEDVTVTYTDHKYPDLPPYQGTYLSATEDASAFESMLAQVGDRIISYESRRYKTQRLVAFSNWPTTDPFLYPEDITAFFMKCAQVDVEHIRTEDAFLAGQFASYHVYPYYPDYLNYILNPWYRRWTARSDLGRQGPSSPGLRRPVPANAYRFRAAPISGLRRTMRPAFANGQKTLYIPIDTTPKTGSTYCENFGLRFEDPVDFVLAIDGRDNSRLLVQERYEVLRAMFYHETHDADAYLDPPDADTPLFKPIDLMLQTATPLLTGNWQASSETYETGDLAYGNANPAAPDYDSLADFIFAGDYVELKLPWQLLNFSDPSRMTIHDDYYENYGVDYITIDTMHLGLTDGAAQERTPLYPAALKGWGNTVSYHERLKPSYYILQKALAVKHMRKEERRCLFKS